jgi:hypothetical protein
MIDGMLSRVRLRDLGALSSRPGTDELMASTI